MRRLPRTRMSHPLKRKIQFTMACLISAIGAPALTAQAQSTATDSVAPVREQATTRNVLIITVDDLRPELNVYGASHIHSPNIDALANSGTRFNKAYCQQAVCGPSRVSVLSGIRPESSGAMDNNTPLRKVMPDHTSMPQFFQKNGYQTISLGKVYHHYKEDGRYWDIKEKELAAKYLGKKNLEILEQRKQEAIDKKLDPTSREYRVLVRSGPYEGPDVPDDAYHDGALTKRAIELMKQNTEKPMFMVVGYRKPHLPFNAPKKYWDLYDRSKIKVPSKNRPKGSPGYAGTKWGEMRLYAGVPKKGRLSDEEAINTIHGYYACVSYIDAQIGKLLEGLKEAGLDQNTIIVLWGDHGWKLGDYGMWCKHTTFEIDTHVPFLVRVPGQQPGVTDALVEMVDIYPTVADYAKLNPPKNLEGQSVLPLIQDPKRPWKKAAFSIWPTSKGNGYSVTDGKFRLTQWKDKSGDKVKATELYDHSSNAIAQKNLTNDEKYKEDLTRLEALLKKGWKDAKAIED